MLVIGPVDWSFSFPTRFPLSAFRFSSYGSKSISLAIFDHGGQVLSVVHGKLAPIEPFEMFDRFSRHVEHFVDDLLNLLGAAVKSPKTVV